LGEVCQAGARDCRTPLRRGRRTSTSTTSRSQSDT
jgi:hypothetical protein